ncbi:MAG TPA: DNA polymerase epsilon catalytic subunit A [Brevibacterium sp.]|nr:DNA polymerase epsilon catalytic subunit A [Brevibacterium sp.]
MADELGYANRGTVYRLVREVLNNTRPEDVLEASIVADRRIESLLHAWWHDAVSGNIPAAQLVLRIIDLQIRLFRLHLSPDQPSSAPTEIPRISPADLVAEARAREQDEAAGPSSGSP